MNPLLRSLRRSAPRPAPPQLAAITLASSRASRATKTATSRSSPAKATSLLLLLLAPWAADRLLPPNFARLTPSKEVLAANNQLLRAFPAQGGTWRLRTAPADVDPRYLALLLAAEDRRFRQHGGVDPGALLRAAWQYARAGRIVSGGSTLSMQTARLLEPHRRSLIGKLHDVLRAWQIEERCDKDAILSMYLTLAPFGGNIEGVRAASLAWFGHDASHLTEQEAALLVAIPQSPARRRPDRHPEAASRAAALLIARLRAAGTLPAAWSDPSPTPDPAPRPDPASSPALSVAGTPATLSLSSPARSAASTGPTAPAPITALAVTRHPMPRLAALFCAALARAAPPGAAVHSTIDAALQRRLEALLARAMVAEPPEVGIAAMVVDNATRSVRASVGGRGPGLPGADLDLTATSRSPGSALKPFIYGMAFDAGWLHPLTLIGDAPGLVAGYAPHNFDYLYHGSITAQTALRQSFNVPAVEVLQRVGADRFVAGLRQAGARIALPGRQASLAVALGGLGISLSDMVMLYAALADDGRAAPLLRTEDDAVPPLHARGDAAPPLRAQGDAVPPLRARGDAAQGAVAQAAAAQKVAFMGPLATYYLRIVLEGSPPPPGMAYAALTGGRAVAFKTGTSYGFRDAWAVGTTPSSTVGIWTGRVEGTPRPGSFGRATAAPLMLQTFGLLPPETDAVPPPPPGAILAQTTAELPPALRRMGPASPTAANRPVLDYPPPGATIDLTGTPGAYAPVTLRVRGGTAPFRWMVNGAPLPGHAAEQHWAPDGPGSAWVTVIGADDLAARGSFRLAD